MKILHNRHSILSFLMCLLLAAAGTMTAWAQGGAGVRAGVSADPDQFYFGGHLELGPLLEQLWFRPNLEIGIGDHRTLAAFNGEFTYWFPFPRSDWSAYVGAGPALNLIRFDADRFGNRGTEAEGGFNILFGLGHDEGLFTELKVGVMRSPGMKLGIGYTFR